MSCEEYVHPVATPPSTRKRIGAMKANSTAETPPVCLMNWRRPFMASFDELHQLGGRNGLHPVSGAVLADGRVARPLDGEAYDLSAAVDTGKVAEEINGLVGEINGPGKLGIRRAVEVVLRRSGILPVAE